jgi:DNA-directed RNA polymerase beta subunit
VCWICKFGDVSTSSKPHLKDDKTGEAYPYYPHHARIRNLTYQIESKVDFHIEQRKRKGKRPGELIKKYPAQQIDLCKIPVMIRSSQCHLSDLGENQIMQNKECLYD